MTLQFREEHLPSYHRQVAIKLQTAAAKRATVKGCVRIQNMIFEQEKGIGNDSRSLVNPR